MAIATVMTADRKKVFVDAAWLASVSQLLHYTQASDGVWVPTCDLKQYESGNRPFSA